MIRLSVAIQHHPSRPHLPERLLGMLDYFDGERLCRANAMELVTDPDPDGAPSPWRTARLAWQLTPGWCTHRLVIQDDALPRLELIQLVHEAIREKPDDPLVLFFGENSYPLGIRDYQAAHAAGERWYPLPHVGWVPCVALVLPRDQALDLGAFELPHHDRRSVADDEVVLEWAHSRGLTCYATIPSLVDHDDEQPSLMGTDPERLRSAVVF